MHPILFLDVDGVLNRHAAPGEDGGLVYNCCFNLARVVLISCCKIVLSSAWRYMGHGYNSVFGQCVGSMGPSVATSIFESTIGATRLENGPEPRYLAILDWVAEHRPDRWVAVDDLADVEKLGLGHFLRTDPHLGLTAENADRLIELLAQPDWVRTCVLHDYVGTGPCQLCEESTSPKNVAEPEWVR